MERISKDSNNSTKIGKIHQSDPVILSYVEGYKIPLLAIPTQNSPPPLQSWKKCL